MDTEKFTTAVDQIRSASIRVDVTLNEVPAPLRLAPLALALTAEPTDLDDDSFSGRFVLLHDPDGIDEWAGTFRVVVFFRASLEPDMLRDDLLRRVAWSWVSESTEGLQLTELGGTVTTNLGESFGSLADRPSDGFVEVRASWTPLETDSGITIDSMDEHLNSWVRCMELASGLTPLDGGVVPVNAGRRRG
jgi:hypothetical protein